MADKITDSSKCVATNDSILNWTYTYCVESGSKTNSFCVDVKASEMTDPTSESESKILANAKAKTIKDAWVDTLTEAPVDTVVITAKESVTL